MEDLKQTTNSTEKKTGVYLICEHKMFGHGLEQLLAQQSGSFRVIGHEHDFDRAVAELQRVQPDVVILYSPHPLAAGSRLAAQLLEQHPTLCLISISVHDNRLYTHHIIRQEIQTLDDLLTAVQNNF